MEQALTSLLVSLEGLGQSQGAEHGLVKTHPQAYQCSSASTQGALRSLHASPLSLVAEDPSDSLFLSMCLRYSDPGTEFLTPIFQVCFHLLTSPDRKEVLPCRLLLSRVFLPTPTIPPSSKPGALKDQKVYKIVPIGNGVSLGRLMKCKRFLKLKKQEAGQIAPFLSV